jgi:hypothetical protein
MLPATVFICFQFIGCLVLSPCATDAAHVIMIDCEARETLYLAAQDHFIYLLPSPFVYLREYNILGLTVKSLG